MVHHYLEDHPDYQRETPVARRPPSAAHADRIARLPHLSLPSLPPLAPFAPAWCEAAPSKWIVDHREEIERVHTRLHQETCLTLGSAAAQRLRILDTASLLEASDRGSPT